MLVVGLIKFSGKNNKDTCNKKKELSVSISLGRILGPSPVKSFEKRRIFTTYLYGKTLITFTMLIIVFCFQVKLNFRNNTLKRKYS